MSRDKAKSNEILDEYLLELFAAKNAEFVHRADEEWRFIEGGVAPYLQYIIRSVLDYWGELYLRN